MATQNFSKKQAFSLLEVAVVVVIITLLIVGVITALTIIDKSRVESAKSITRSSPVSSTDGLALWLETSLDGSFEDNDNLNSGNLIRIWNGNSNGIVTQARFVGNGANYIEKGINYVPSVKFSRSTENYLELRDASFINNSDYTIFVVEKRADNSNNNYFLGENPDADPDKSLALGYLVGGEVVHSQGTNLYTAKVGVFSQSVERPRMFSFTQSIYFGKKIHINGILSAQSDDKSRLKNIKNLAIGKNYNGQIGEIIIFNKALVDEERQYIENYLSRKWGIKVDRTMLGDCINGVMTNDGCVVN